MIAFPSAKINLGLNVVRRRNDGYHDIQSVLVRIPLCDALEAVIDPALAANELRFDRTGGDVPGDRDDDLCVKAVRRLQVGRELPGLRVHLHKVIPTGAGLGGGSSDAAATLSLIDRLCDLRLSWEKLLAHATGLGSDVPFFLSPHAQLAEGRGERLRPVQVDLKGKWLLLVHPGVHVATAEVYRAMRPSGSEIDLEAGLRRPVGEWSGRIVNAMEEHVFAAYPVVAQVKKALIDMGAAYAAMSGSGSAVFGIFATAPEPRAWPADHRAWTFQL
jgi:4-diphosphocytidyl-2-C-methyl-D-erythritol kinase